MACGTQAPRVIKDVRLSSKVGGSMMVQIELVVSNACENGMTDGREEGIDCGGPFCSSCNKIDVQEVNSVFPDVITTKTVNIETNLGDFKLELFTEKAPITTRNFIELAEKGFYDGTKFHRVITNFMIQGGDPFSKEDSKKSLWGTGGPGYEIKDEFHPELSNVRGTIAMANHGPDTGGSQFFINLVNNTHLDYNKNPTQSKHPVFGKVTNGMDVVDRISNVETEGDKPVRDVVINKITVEGKLKEEKIMVEPSPGHLQSSGQEDTPPITNHNSRSNKYLLIGLIVFVFLLVGVYLFRTFRKKPRRKRKKKIESEEKPSVYRDVKVAISVSNFKLQYKDKSIIDNVSFEVEKGDMVCLLGGSGTGKSSIIEALVGRKKPTRGDVRIFGEDISKDKEIFNHVGFVPQHPELYMNQSVEKNLLSSATKWGVKGSKEKTEKILSRIGLSHRKELKASKLSGGQLKLLSLGMELLRNPELLILDEPTTGLDPNTRNNIITILSHISSQLHKTILFSTHFMDDAEECDEVIIISGSKIVARGAPSKLEKRLPGGGKIVKIVLDYVTDDLLERIKVIDGVQKVIREGRGLRIITDEPNAVQMGHKIDEFGGIVNETKIDRATMMDVFVYHTGKELKE